MPNLKITSKQISMIRGSLIESIESFINVDMIDVAKERLELLIEINNQYPTNVWNKEISELKKKIKKSNKKQTV